MLKKGSSPDIFGTLKERFSDLSKAYSIGDFEIDFGAAEIIQVWTNPGELKKSIFNGQFNNVFNLEKDYYSLYLLELTNDLKKFVVILDQHDPWLNPKVVAIDDATDVSIELLKSIYPSMNLL